MQTHEVFQRGIVMGKENMLKYFAGQCRHGTCVSWEEERDSAALCSEPEQAPWLGMFASLRQACFGFPKLFM